ncbi:MAG: hypothetical protein KKA60_10230 [Proteobacteria bacterium]|nr:hypothetical protein [Pseudomonadota bacterium]
MSGENQGVAEGKSLREQAANAGVEFSPVPPPERPRARVWAEGDRVRVAYYPGFTAAHVVGVTVSAVVAAPMAALGTLAFPLLALLVIAGFVANARLEVRISASPRELTVSRPRGPFRTTFVLPVRDVLQVWVARFSERSAPPEDPLAVEEPDWREQVRSREARLHIRTSTATLRLPSTAGYEEMRWIASILRARLTA